MKSQFPLVKALIASSLSLLAMSHEAYAQADSMGPAAQVDALNGVFGKHAGARGSHAKGFCAKGDFAPAAKISLFVKSPLFEQKKIDTVLRFSIGGGNPSASEEPFRSRHGDPDGKRRRNLRHGPHF